MLRKQIIILFILLFPLILLASHNRGGEITYTHLGGLTYEFTITTCTDLGSNTGTDREELYIDFDIGTFFAQKDTFQRTSQVSMPLNHKKNIYVGIHTFTSTGTHRITIEDPNRNAGILNVNPTGNSDDIVFALETILIISPTQGASGGNNSVQFDECPCPAIACVNKPYCYNPLAYDPDGDSLSYELVHPLGTGAVTLPPTLYYYPDVIGGGNFFIDPAFGTICWYNPMLQGEYNFTIKITEWRNSYVVGSVLRDVQLTVQSNCPNDPPLLSSISDTCLQAGEDLTINVQGTDPNPDILDLVASGLPLSLTTSPATFSTVSTTGLANGIFHWSTTCSHIQQSSYQVMIELTDDGIPVFSDYEPFSISVRPPPVSGIEVQPIGNAVNVSWDQASCFNAIGYNVYRKNGYVSPQDNCCSNPDLIGGGMLLIHQSTSITDTNFIDNSPLLIGIQYCYVVTAIYDFGLLESCPSDTSCAMLKKEVPIINQVSVNKTSVTNGEDTVSWFIPPELDTIQYPGPYHYKVFDNQGTFFGQTVYNLYLANTDTFFAIKTINTIDTNRHYQIGLYYTNNGNDSLVGYSNLASSIHAYTIPNDNQIELNWTEIVPWINEEYYIYRSDSFSGNYALIDSALQTTYLDIGLINRKDYCYQIRSRGYYTDTSLNIPLYNFSQKVCDQPFDYTPPCPPDVEITGDCEQMMNTLQWTNPNNSCSDDAMTYQLYFTHFEDSVFLPIFHFNQITDTSFIHQFNYNGTVSVAGCYYITATDSIIYNNESFPSDTVCFDNCPIYIFPNVFTPNADGENDYFQALMPVMYIDSVQLQIFNRWGQQVYTTNNPLFTWNGNSNQTDAPCPSGIYYYHATINTIRLSGLEKLELTGFLHLIRDNKTQNN